MIYLALRYDDFGYQNPDYDRMLLSVAASLGIPLTIGIVPGSISSDLLYAVSRAEPNVELAMHGILHGRASKRRGECIGNPTWYTKLLEHFKNRLEQATGRRINTYIPPGTR